MICSDTRRKAASHSSKRAWLLRQEEARQQRLARWQMFQPVTRRILSQVETLVGAALADQLAEAIQSELQEVP